MGANMTVRSRWHPSVGFRRAEDGDAVVADAGALVGIVDAEALVGRQAEHAELALVQVVVDLTGRRPMSSSGYTADSSGWILPWSISRLAAHASS